MFLNNLQREYFNKVVCSRNGNYFIIMNFLHLFITVGTIVYPLLTHTNSFDPYYLVFLYILIIQWIVLKNECLVNYLEKCKINSEYKLGTNIQSPGINYILSNFNFQLYNHCENEIYNEGSHNLTVPLIMIILFSYVTIRYFKQNTTRFIFIFIYFILVYLLLFKLRRL